MRIMLSCLMSLFFLCSCSKSNYYADDQFPYETQKEGQYWFKEDYDEAHKHHAE